MVSSQSAMFKEYHHVSLEKALNSRVSTGGGVNHFGKPSGKPVEPRQLEFVLRCLARVPRLSPEHIPLEIEGRTTNLETLTPGRLRLHFEPKPEVSLRWPVTGQLPYESFEGDAYHLEMGMAQEMVHVSGAIAQIGVCMIGGRRVDLVGMEPYLSIEVPPNQMKGDLPDVRRDGPVPAVDCIDRWKASAKFQDKDLTLEELGQLLWAGCGCAPHTTYRKEDEPFRRQGKTIPSAQATYTIVLYAISLTGVFRYLNWDESRQRGTHALNKVGEGESLHKVRSENKRWPLPPCYILAASNGRLSPFLSVMEAGYSALHVCLQAQALRIGSAIMPLGPSEAETLRKLLSINDRPIALIPVGHFG